VRAAAVGTATTQLACPRPATPKSKHFLRLELLQSPTLSRTSAGAAPATPPPPLFTRLSHQVACKDCPAGTYSGGAAVSCAPCAAGSFTAANGSAVCAPCGVGSASANDSATSCEACSPGKAQAASGQVACAACAAGTFSADPGAAVCTQVCNKGPGNNCVGVRDEATPPRRTRRVSSPTAPPCLPVLVIYSPRPLGALGKCSAGSASSAAGQSACVSCAPGKYQGRAGASGCDDCPAETAAPAEGSSACTPCPVTGLHRAHARWEHWLPSRASLKLS